MEWQATVEDALQREIAAGRLTRLEANELHRRLGLLAFNMTAAGHEGEIAKEVAASWLRYLRHRGLEKRPAVPLTKQARAARWWGQGSAAGLLSEREDSIAFVDRGLQDHFCLHFCQTHPLNTHLLRLASRESFREVWQRWAEQDSTLADQLNALLLGEWQAKGGLRAALPLHYLGDTRAVDALIVALNDTDDGVCIRAAMALSTLGDLRALELLTTRQAQEKRLPVRVPLIEALGGFGEPAIPFLTTLLESPNQNVVRASIRGLGRTDTPEAAVALTKLLNDIDTNPTETPLTRALNYYTTHRKTTEAIKALNRLGCDSTITGAMKRADMQCAQDALIQLQLRSSVMSGMIRARFQDAADQLKKRYDPNRSE